MGNYRFRLSDMMPNSWFYKLRDMGIRRRNQKKEPASASPTLPQQILLHSHPRKSHHFTRELAASREFVNSPTDIINFAADPPRKSSKGKPRRKPTAKTSPRLVVTSSSVPSGCSCGRAVESDGPPLRLPSPPSEYLVERESSHQPELGSDPTPLSQCSFDGLACGCHTNPDANAIIIEVEQKSPAKNFNDSDELKSLAQIELPPIITKPSKPEETDADGSLCPSVTITKKDKSFAREQRNSPSRRFLLNSPGPKLRMNSPRVSSKRFGQVSRRKSVSSSSKRSLTDSLAIVKSSNDPQRDFRESMVEMIVEHKISASNELEDLLACYLSLNTDEYHDTIIKVFKQIWFDMTDIGVK